MSLTRLVGLSLGLGGSAAATVAFAYAVRGHAFFIADDYAAFYGVLTQSLGDFLMTPVDVHLIPLHQLASWLIYKTAPLNFDLALGVMCFVHLVTVWMLYRTLEILGPPWLAGPLTLVYGTNVYVSVLFMWWTAGIARLPYIFFSIAALYSYLKVRESASAARVIAIAACTGAACAFFSKGLLIPGFLAAVELALIRETSRRDLVRNFSVVCLVALVVIGWRILTNAYVTQEILPPVIQWKQQIALLGLAFTILHQGAFGILLTQPFAIANWLVAGAWSTAFILTCIRERFNLLVWLILAAVVAANVLIVTLSARLRWPGIIEQERYYFDILFLVAIFAAILARNSRAVLSSISQQPLRVARVAMWGAAFVVAVASQRSFDRLLEKPRYSGLPAVRSYATNVMGEFATLRRDYAGTLEFAPGVAPREVLGFSTLTIGHFSKFLLIFDPDVHVVSGHAKCAHRVLDDGTIVSPPAGCKAP